MNHWFGIVGTLFITQILWANGDFKIIHVADLDHQIQSKMKNLHIYDANIGSTRKFVGIIPGAKLLNSSSDYDVSKELPSNKTSALVFYCANELCTASHSAAKRAINNGYKNVSVMVDGIYGWKKAGKSLTAWTPRTVTAASAAISNKAQPTTASLISPIEAHQLLTKNEALIVDVRETEERHQIIRKSLSFPISQIKDEAKWVAFLTQLPSNKTIIFHCAVGARSKRVAEILAKEGFKTAFFQGPDQWEQAGLPLEKGPAQ
jgi:rhodanese-related sulfurtransferase